MISLETVREVLAQQGYDASLTQDGTAVHVAHVEGDVRVRRSYERTIAIESAIGGCDAISTSAKTDNGLRRWVLSHVVPLVQRHVDAMRRHRERREHEARCVEIANAVARLQALAPRGAVVGQSYGGGYAITYSARAVDAAAAEQFLRRLAALVEARP